MQKNRIRITPIYTGDTQISYTDVKATVVKTNESGCLDTQYVSKSKFKEMVDNGFAYINQYAHRIV